VEYCFGLALLMDARHVSGAAKASGASATALTELKLKLSVVTKATGKPNLDLLGPRRSQNCGSTTTERNPILARAKDCGKGLSPQSGATTRPPHQLSPGRCGRAGTGQV
jgi:hypothetical protein